MNIIARKREFLQLLIVRIPPKVSRLFLFGYDTLVAQDITSTRANARRAMCSWITAKSKMWRLLKNRHLASAFPSVLAQLTRVSARDVIAIDFSDFGHGRQVLMFARQTQRGRAVPVYFEILEYPIKKGSQNLFVIDAIRHFFALSECAPILVFDRGFACPSIIHFLAQNQYQFIIRIKKRKFLCDALSAAPNAAELFEENDVHAHAYGEALRLIRSDDPKNGNDPWYLITNDTHSTRSEIIARYYHRFEIEEFFRDAKHILGFEYLNFKTLQGLTTALWFALLSTWFFTQCALTLSEAEETERLHWHVSRFRYVYETFMRERLQARDQNSYTLFLPLV